VIEKSSGPVVRASRPPHLERWLELPIWMFDQAFCSSMSMALSPRVDLPALSALQALLASRLSGDRNERLSAHAPVSGAAKESCGPKNRGSADAIPRAVKVKPANSTSSFRHGPATIRSCGAGSPRRRGKR